jgi:D-glyceraldehyde dehydrogenase (NADP+)
MVAHKKVAVITMTGSTETGQRIMEKASANMAKLILELGGKAPFIVWKDADIKNALKTLLWAKFWNAGQSCIAAERVYVHEDIYDSFVQKFAAATSSIKVGDPETADMGPLINASALTGMEKVVETAKDDGAKVLAGGSRPKLPGKLASGYFYLPTVLEEKDQKASLFQNEVFGPITGVMKVGDLDTAFELANDSRYGLASYLFTNDVTTAMRATERVRFGEIYINMPGPEASQGYHTGFRMTGQSGEGSLYGIEEYLKIKNVYIDYSGKPLSISTVRDDLLC